MPNLATIPFPDIGPIAISIGRFSISWYALAYIAGLLLAVWYAKRLVANPALWPNARPSASVEQIDDLLLWCTLGVVLGGRLGYVLFYNPAFYAANPDTILKVWHGGMSFHGGFLGVVIVCWGYGKRHGIGLDRLLDLGAASVPIGLGLGRIANFINGELWGAPTDLPWGVIFPYGGPEPRHPSQLYEACLEGLALFLAVRVVTHRLKLLPHPGVASGVFAIGYGLARILVEFVRTPDAHIGYLAGDWVTMGMVLSLPLMAAGLWLIVRANRQAGRQA